MTLYEDILYEFQGALRIEDIERLTYKELGYLREARRARYARNKARMDEERVRRELERTPVMTSGAKNKSDSTNRR